MALQRLTPWWSGLLATCFVAVWFGAPIAEAADYEPPSVGVDEPALLGEPACPEPPVEVYEGEDEAANEVRQLRTAVSAICSALVARLDALGHRAWWLVAEAIAASEQRALGNEKLTAANEVLGTGGGLPVQLPAGPLEVSDSESPAVAAAVDASGEAVKEGLWFLVGVSVALFAAYGLYRQVMPRA